MGSRSSAYCCQKFTNAISFIMFKLGIYILNYLDDMASAEIRQNAEFAFKTLQAVLKSVALKKLRTSGLKCPAKLFSILTTGLRGKDLMFLKGN